MRSYLLAWSLAGKYHRRLPEGSTIAQGSRRRKMQKDCEAQGLVGEMLCQSRGSASQPAPGSVKDPDFLEGLKSEDLKKKKKDDQLEKRSFLKNNFFAAQET